MRTHKRLVLEQRKKIEQLLSLGVSYQKIAQELKKSFNCISVEIRKYGGRKDYKEVEAQKRSDLNKLKTLENITPEKRKEILNLNIRNKGLSLEERQKMEELLSTGISCREIARQINRSPNCVITEIRKNGGNKLYKASEAQIYSELKNKNKTTLLKQINEVNEKDYKYKIRIENLEMQIEILHETIQGILNVKQN